MKKIRHIRQLNEEKKRLRIRQLELEKEMRQSWQDLKESLQPKNFLKNKLADLTHSETKEKNLFSSVLSHGAAYLIRQFVDAAGEKIENGVQNGVENMVHKLKTVFRKKR